MLRKLALVLVPFAACSVVVSAQAATPTQLTLKPEAYKILYGKRLTLTGTLVGGLAGQTVSIMAQPYSKSPTPAKRVARAQTRLGGGFSINVKPTIQTTYTARAGGLTSAPITVGVAPSVSIEQLTNGRVRAEVEGGRSFKNRFVKMQALTSGAWKTVAQKRLGPASVAVFSKAVATTSPVRIAMSVNQSGAGYLSGASHPIRYKAHSLTIATPAYKVLFGKPVRLSGELLNGTAGQTITIAAQPYGSSAPRVIAKVKTTDNGRWTYAAKPSIQTSYRARWGGAQASDALTVGVRPMMSIRRLENGDIWTQVAAGKALTGKLVKLQQRTGKGAWATVAQRPLNAKSATTFRIQLPTSPVRVAMSVNQAGKGLLGATSHPLTYLGVLPQ